MVPLLLERRIFGRVSLPALASREDRSEALHTGSTLLIASLHSCMQSPPWCGDRGALNPPNPIAERSQECASFQAVPWFLLVEAHGVVQLFRLLFFDPRRAEAEARKVREPCAVTPGYASLHKRTEDRQLALPADHYPDHHLPSCIQLASGRYPGHRSEFPANGNPVGTANTSCGPAVWKMQESYVVSLGTVQM